VLLHTMAVAWRFALIAINHLDELSSLR